MGEFLLTAITSDAVLVRTVEAAGVDRVGVDIERLGKHERQDPSKGARISSHEIEHLATVSGNVVRAQPFVRINPWHDGSIQEIERSLACGARVMMLPYFREVREACCFAETVAGRATAILLIETPEAVERIRELVRIPGVDEIMVGLNDLHLSLQLSHPFEALGLDLMDRMADEVRAAGLRFGFGGVTRPDQILPVPPDLVLAQYARLGATSAFVARSLYRGISIDEIPGAVRQVRERLAFWFAQPAPVLEEQRFQLAAAVRRLQ